MENIGNFVCFSLSRPSGRGWKPHLRKPRNGCAKLSRHFRRCGILARLPRHAARCRGGCGFQPRSSLPSPARSAGAQMVLAGPGRAGVGASVVGGHAGSFRCIAVQSGHLVVGVVGACESVAGDGGLPPVVLHLAPHRNEGLALGMPLRVADRREVHPVSGLRFARVAHRRRLRPGRARSAGIRILRVKKKGPAPTIALWLPQPFFNRWKTRERFFQSLEKPAEIFQPLEKSFPIIGKLAFCRWASRLWARGRFSERTDAQMR